MQDLKRFRRPEQIYLFQSPRILPSWKELPADTHQAVTQLLVKMLRDHHRHLNPLQKKGGGTHE
jgi:hypothetical protein